LAVTITKNKNNFEFDWFHKSIFSGKYLNFYSQYPLTQKQGTIMDMTYRAILLLHSKFYKKISNRYVL